MQNIKCKGDACGKIGMDKADFASNSTAEKSLTINTVFYMHVCVSWMLWEEKSFEKCLMILLNCSLGGVFQSHAPLGPIEA